jgi:hypothetical protein
MTEKEATKADDTRHYYKKELLQDQETVTVMMYCSYTLIHVVFLHHV